MLLENEKIRTVLILMIDRHLGNLVVGLFGPVDEKRWRPLSPNSVVLRGQDPCLDCRDKRKDCHDFPCITTLPPDRVKQAISELLAAEESKEPGP